MAETIKGLNIKLSLDASELNEKLSNLTKTLKEEQLNLRAINKSLKFDPTNIELWKAKQDTLNQAITLTNDRINATKAKLSDAKKELEVGAIGEKEFNKLARSVLYAETDIKKFNLELSKVKNELNNLNNAKFDNLSKIGKNFSKKVTSPIVGAITALKGLSIASLNAAGSLYVSADKLNMSTESFQKFSYISRMISLDQTKLVNGFKEINKMLSSIASGNIDGVNLKLECIGLTVKDLEGLSADKAFLKIRDAISKLESSSLKTNAAITIFGDKIGQDLIPLLSLSNKELNTYEEEMEELGVISTEDAKIAREFQKEIIRIQIAFKNIGFELAKILLPCINFIIDVIQNSLIPAINNLINWWNKLDKIDKELIITFGLIAISIGPVFTWIAILIPTLHSLKLAFTTTSGSVMLFGHAVKLSTLGVGAFVTAVSIILLQNDKFRESLANVLKVLGNFISKIINVLSEIISSLTPLFNVILSFINRSIDILVSLLNKAINPIKKVLDIIVRTLENVIPIIEKVVSSIISLLEPALNSIIKIIKPIVQILGVVIDLIIKIGDELLKLINTNFKKSQDLIQNIGSTLVSVINVLSKIIVILSKLLTPILKVIQKLLEPIIGAIKLIIDIVINAIDAISPLLELVLIPLTFTIKSLSWLLSSIAPILTILGELLEEVFKPVLEAIYVLLEPFIDLINGIIDGISYLFTTLFGGLEVGNGKILDFTNLFQNSFFETINKIVIKFLDFFKFVGNGIKGLINNITNFAQDLGTFLSNLINSFVDWLGNLFNRIGDFFKGIWDWICGLFGGGSNETKLKEVENDFIKSNQQMMSANYQISNNENKQVNNYLTINTTSPTIDIDDINRQLGGSYL